MGLKADAPEAQSSRAGWWPIGVKNVTWSKPPSLNSSTVRGFRLRRLLILVDLVGFAVALVVSTALHESLKGDLDSGSLLLAIGICVPVWFLIAHAAGLYHLTERHIEYSLAEEAAPLFMVTTAWIWLLLLVASVTVSGALSLFWFFVLWLGSIIFILAGRAFARRLTRDRHWYRQDVLLVGNQHAIDLVRRRIDRHSECGLDIVGLLERQGGTSCASAVGGSEGAERVKQSIEINGAIARNPEDVALLVSEARIQRVIVAEWGNSVDYRTELIRVLATSGVFVDMVSGEPEALCVGASVHHLEGLPIMTIKPTTMTKHSRLLKRVIDVVAASLGLVVLSPLLLYLVVRIRLDSPGPALFTQSRAGRDGRAFNVVKLRTMVEEAEGRRSDLREVNGGKSGLFKLASDPRITSYGSKLRRRSLDELPQLWNVLRGDMSLVGPRPLPLDEAPLAQGHFADRLRVRPGITGPWQIHGRSDIPFEDMIKLDYTYVSTWSLQEDLRLLIKTAGVVLGGRGAY